MGKSWSVSVYYAILSYVIGIMVIVGLCRGYTGDPEAVDFSLLLQQVLQSCDVVLYDRLAQEAA